MRKKRLAALGLAASMALTLFPFTAFAAKSDILGGEGTNLDEGGADDVRRPDDDGGRKEDESSTSYSGTEITIPENLLDGNYTGIATVHPNEENEFDEYAIDVTVTIENGALVTFNLSGVNGRNSAYSSNAQTGILNQIKSIGSSDSYTIDAVSGATCSTTAIVQGINSALKNGEALSGTYYSIENEVTYNSSGSSFLVTVHNPEAGVDYDITLAYGVGKFSDDLAPTDDFCSVKLIEDNESEKVYQVTLKPNTVYEIVDDENIHKLYVNNPGTSLAVKVNNENVGTFTIKSTAIPSITNNILSLSGGNGDTLTDYLELINEVTVTYTDENGKEVTTTYTTTWQHDMDPAFTGSDLFNEDGSINYDIIAKVTQTGDDLEAIQDENGNNVTTDVKVFPYGAAGDYSISFTAGDGYEAVNAHIGASYVAKEPESSQSETKEINTESTADDTVPNTGDTSPLAIWAVVLVLAVLGIGTKFISKKHRI